jgi:hypothetical protein
MNWFRLGFLQELTQLVNDYQPDLINGDYCTLCTLRLRCCFGLIPLVGGGL